METRANYALIGLFTLAVLAAAFGFVFWFSGKDAGAKLNALPHHLQRLGVRPLARRAGALQRPAVGEVVSLELLPEDPSKVVARVEIDARTPMNVDTRRGSSSRA